MPILIKMALRGLGLQHDQDDEATTEAGGHEAIS